MTANEYGVNPLLDFIQRYGPAAGEEGPVLFVREVLGAKPDEWQEDFLRAYGRGERRISMRACHGPGKTCAIAWAVVHQQVCRFPQKTVATAPTRGQLFDALFAEVMTWFTKLPEVIQQLYTTKSDRIELTAAPDESFFSARTARRESPEALQGVHCDPGYVLLVVDEASGVEEAIFEAAVGSMSQANATSIMASNPTKTSGTFFESQTKLKKQDDTDRRPGTWLCFHIGAHNSPRVTPDFISDVAARYGEDSNQYRVRVLGEFPKSDEDTVVPFHLVESARERDIEVPPEARRVWTVDVARFGADISVIMERTQRSAEWAKPFKGLDTMQLTGRIKQMWDEAMPDDRPYEILVDVIGLGAGVVDRLKELGLPVRGINVSESASMSEAYINLRAELWFKAREWLEERQGRINPALHDLCAELVVPRYEYTSNGKIKVESKDSMKKRGHKSPNFADAFVLSFASNAVTATSGRKSRLNRGEPLRRNIPGVI
jgi:hypothetical protein